MSKRKASVASSAVVRKPKHVNFDRVSLTESLAHYGKIPERELASRAVNEFFDRFMKLKKITKDADASLLCPSHIIDLVWRTAVLHTAAYAEWCENEVGFFVNYLPFDGDVEARQRRYERTYNEYLDVWGEPERLLWPPPDAFRDVDDPVAGSFCIFFESLSSRTYGCRMLSAHALVSTLKQRIQDIEGIPACQQRLLFGGKQLEDKHRLFNVGIREDDKVYLRFEIAWLLKNENLVTFLNPRSKLTIVRKTN